MSSTSLDLFRRVLEVLRSREIPHAVAGAAAMAVHGVSRSTLDVDILTTDGRVLDSEMWSDLEGEGTNVEIRRGDAEDPLRGVIRFTSSTDRPVDVVIGRFAWQSEAITDSEERDIGVAIVPVLSASALILTKLFAGGPQDAWDIEQILAAGSRPVIHAEVEKRIQRLSPEAQALWKRIG